MRGVRVHPAGDPSALQQKKLTSFCLTPARPGVFFTHRGPPHVLPKQRLTATIKPKGGLAEWSNAPHSKCGWGEIPSQVRILYPPQSNSIFISPTSGHASRGAKSSFPSPSRKFEPIFSANSRMDLLSSLFAKVEADSACFMNCMAGSNHETPFRSKATLQEAMKSGDATSYNAAEYNLIQQQN